MYRILIIFGLLLIALPAVSAGAEDPTPDAYETNFANIIGIIGAGGADWYVSYPTDVPTTGTYHAAITVSTTAAATANLGITAGSFQGSGCTIGSFVSDTSATSQASGYLPITTTGPYCYGSVRLTITSGATTITAIRASFQIASDTVIVSDDANGWALTGIPTPPSNLTIADDANGWIVHQDPISGTLEISGSLNQTLNFGNATVNNNSTSIFPTTITVKHDGTMMLGILFPLLLFGIAVVYAETTKILIAYVAAIVVGAAVIIGLWSGFDAIVRTFLVIVMVALVARLFYLKNKSGDS